MKYTANTFPMRKKEEMWNLKIILKKQIIVFRTQKSQALRTENN